MSEQAAVDRFKKLYGRDPEVIASAPGRINLIGEHTDYNDGFVFPAAIDKHVYVAGQICDGQSELVSIETGKSQPFDARRVEPGDVKEWGAYAAGMAWALREAGHGEMPNIQAVATGEVPIGSGLSSSAAIELAFGVLWAELAKKIIPNKDMALIGQQCENKFVGVNSGIMDQMASAMGKAGHAMFLDTRSLEIKYHPVPEHVSIVVCDTKKPRALTDSAYNERRSQCEEASRILGVKALRDANLADLEKHKPGMDPVVYRRARHVITEDERCVEFGAALDSGDLKRIGELMKASHVSLRDDYEVSCMELDRMAEAAWAAPGCIGARMTGAGFGGACVALVETNDVKPFTDFVLRHYRETAGRAGEITACELVDGAQAHRTVIKIR
jgi:galactokinase